MKIFTEFLRLWMELVVVGLVITVIIKGVMISTLYPLPFFLLFLVVTGVMALALVITDEEYSNNKDINDNYCIFSFFLFVFSNWWVIRIFYR
jgi:hypothetical protein